MSQDMAGTKFLANPRQFLWFKKTLPSRWRRNLARVWVPPAQHLAADIWSLQKEARWAPGWQVTARKTQNMVDENQELKESK